MTDQSNDTAALRDLLDKVRFVMLTTIEAEGGALVSRPMTVQEVDERWVVRFICQADNKVAAEADGHQVNLASMDGTRYVSLSGTGRVERDLAKKRELWDRLTEAYAGDAEDPNNVILEVQLAGAEYWDGGNPIVQLAGLAKAALTGERPEGGDHQTVSL